MSGSQPYPFAFFGAEPSDWFELKGDLFSYELCFAAPPDAAARRAVGEAWERALDPRAVELCEPFLWADRWALVRVRPAGWSKPCIADMASAIQRAVTAAHGAHALEVVSLAEALESDTDWDAWSTEQIAEPPVGPRWPVELPRSGAGERFEAACAVDPEVEAARAAARAAPPEKGRSWASEAGDDEGANEEVAGGDDDDKPRVISGGIRLEHVPGYKAPEPSDEHKKLFGSRAELQIAPNGLVFGVTRPKRQAPVPAWVEHGELRAAQGAPLARSYSLYFAARDDGGAALIGDDCEGVWEVVFAEGSVRRLFKHDESLSDVAYGPEDRVLLVADSTIDAYRREGSGAVLEVRWDLSAYGMRSILGGRVLLVKCYDDEDDGTDGVTILGYDGSAMRRLGRVRMSIGDIVIDGARVLVDDCGKLYELLGLEELGARFAAQPGSFPELKQAKPGGEDEDEDASDDDASDDDASDDGASDEEDEAEGEDSGDRPEVLEGAIRAERRKPREVPAEPRVDRAQRELFGSSSRIEVAPGGRVYGIAKPRRKPACAAWIEGGELRLAEGEALPSPYGYVAARQDGGAVLYGFDYKLVAELSFEDGKLRRLFEHEESISEVCYGLEGRVIMASGESLDVYRREGEGAVLEQRWAVDGYGMTPAFDGRLLLVKSYEGEDSEDGLTILGFDGGKLRRVGRVKASVGEVRFVEGRAFMDHAGDTYELFGLDALVEQLASSPEAFPEVAEYTPPADDGDDDDEAPESGPQKAPEEYAVEPAPGRVGLRYLGKQSPLPEDEEDVPKDVRARFGTGARDVERYRPAGVYLGWKKESRRSFIFAVLKDGELVETEIKTGSTSALGLVSADRTVAMVPTDNDSKLWWVELPRGKPVQVHDFSKEESEDEIYTLELFPPGRVIVGTASETWIFSVSGGTSRIEARGALDLRAVECAAGGRVAVLEVSEGEPLRVWGIYEDGVRTLAELGLEPLNLVPGPDGRFFVEAMGRLGWYELVNLEDAWEAGRRDASGEQYPRVVLAPKPPEEEEEHEQDDEDEDEEATDGDDEDGDDEDSEDADSDGDEDSAGDDGEDDDDDD